ncbi:Endonuclease/exonuclease/phosphatase, partial [Cerioporus squamosus]
MPSSSLHVVYHNVNHSPQHTHFILERCAAMNVDVVCLQEPWYGPIRPIPSASPAGPAERTDDNMLYGTQLHPAWSLVEVQKDARVVCHVSRRIANAVISLDPTVNHRDCMLLLVRLEPEHDPVAILNLYNDSRNSAVSYLTDISHLLPALDIMGGDYNTHSPLWDPDYPPDSMARTSDVLDLHARLGLRLLSPPGVATHIPHRTDFRSTVIDLVWVPDDRDHGLYSISVAQNERGMSDHAVIHAHIPAGQWSYEGAPSITPKSEAEKSFISSIKDTLRSRLPLNTPLDTEASLCLATDILFSCISDSWLAHATPTVICSKSRLWWDASCTKARKALERAQARLKRARRSNPRRIPAARAAVEAARRCLKTTIRRRRRQHMDERINFIATEQR